MDAWILSFFIHVQLFVTVWTIADQASLSMRFSRQEYWNGLVCPFPGDLPDQGMEPMPLMSLELAGRFFTTSATWEAYPEICCCSVTRSCSNLQLHGLQQARLPCPSLSPWVCSNSCPWEGLKGYPKMRLTEVFISFMCIFLVGSCP